METIKKQEPINENIGELRKAFLKKKEEELRDTQINKMAVK